MEHWTFDLDRWVWVHHVFVGWVVDWDANVIHALIESGRWHDYFDGPPPFRVPA